MGFYEKMQKTSNRLLISKGQAVTLIHTVTGEYVPGSGVTTTVSTQYGTGAVTEWDSRQVDGTIIRQGDRRLLLSALNTAGAALTAPAIEDTATVGGVTYTITQVKQTNPAGTVVLYDLNLRV